MDTSASDIHFDENGICNYCSEFLERAGQVINLSPSLKAEKLNEFVEQVKRDGKGKRYDCVIGVSGGVDSSWMLVSAVRLGLRPLAVHMDNGWNSELAQNNIANLVQGLGVDLFTHVIDWDEYRNLMQAFFDADVIDIELLYDNAMLAVNYQQASNAGVRYILGGHNLATEGMTIPRDWNWFKCDKRNIKAIAKKFGNVRLKTFPAFGTADYVWLGVVKRIRWATALDMMEYNKFAVLQELQASYGYKPYPYKHYESVFTRFYQGYILPRKFAIDKRRVHLGTLVVTGQMSRDAALKILEGSPYPSEESMDEDRLYFIKKMRWTEGDLESYLGRPEKPHDIYGSEKAIWNLFSRAYRIVSPRQA